MKMTMYGQDSRGYSRDMKGESPISLLQPKYINFHPSDMLTRISFWCSLTEIFGWDLPPKEPLTKAEHIEEEGIHKAIKEAMESASDDDLQTPCRSSRLIIGFKELRRSDEEEEI